MKTLRTNAIVVHRTNYGEADRIMSVITPEYGKLNVIARGVRKEKSKLAGGIELLAVTELTLHEGKGDLRIVTSARLETFFKNILANYDKLQLAYYILKDINRASEVVPEPEFYELTRQSFEALNEEAISYKIVSLWYRLQMAILLGVGLNLATDREGNKLDANERYRFVPSESVFVIDSKGAYDANHIKLLRLASAQSPRVVAQVSGLNTILDDCLYVAVATHE